MGGRCQRLELTVIRTLIHVRSQKHTASSPPLPAVFYNFTGTLSSGFGFGGCRLHETERARRFGLGGCRLHETERARRFATVAEVEVVRCITSRSDQTGKYFSYNFGVVFSLLSIRNPTSNPPGNARVLRRPMNSALPTLGFLGSC